MKPLNIRRTRQTPIRPGDSVRDIEPGWPNYMETGTVAKIQGNRVLWKSDKTGKFLIDEIRKLEKI